MASAGVVAGGALVFGLGGLIGTYFEAVRTPGTVVVIGSAVVLVAAAAFASLVPASRAARVDVVQALR